MTDKIPKWALRATLLFSLPISAGALYLTREYGLDNLAALNLDANTLFVRRLSIDVLLAAHVAAFFIIAMLPDSVFKFRRWQLRILALAIWAFDGTMIFQARLGIMQGADNVQVSAAARVVDQRAAIKGLRDSASALRALSVRQLSNTMITPAAASQKEAARLEAKAADMSEKLALMPTGAGVTEIKTIGWFAPYKAAIESALVSFVSLIMLGLAGLSARMLLDARERPAAVISAPAAPTPAPVPAPATATVSYSTRALRGLGVLTGGAAAVAAPVAHSAPAAPSIPSNPGELKDAPAPACTPADADALMPAAPAAPAKPASAPDVPAPKSAPVEPAELAPDTLAQVQQVQSAEPDAPGKVQVQAQSARRKLPDGVREAVRSGAVKPTQAGLKSLGVGQGYAAEWLAQLCAEGITERDGKGYKLKGGVA